MKWRVGLPRLLHRSPRSPRLGKRGTLRLLLLPPLLLLLLLLLLLRARPCPLALVLLSVLVPPPVAPLPR